MACRRWQKSAPAISMNIWHNSVRSEHCLMLILILAGNQALADAERKEGVGRERCKHKLDWI